MKKERQRERELEERDSLKREREGVERGKLLEKDVVKREREREEREAESLKAKLKVSVS